MADNPQSNTSYSHCPVCGSFLVYVSTGELPCCPQGVSSRQCPVDPNHLWKAVLTTSQSVGFTKDEAQR